MARRAIHWWLRLWLGHKTAFHLVGFFSLFFTLLAVAAILSHDSIQAAKAAYKTRILATLTNCPAADFVPLTVDQVSITKKLTLRTAYQVIQKTAHQAATPPVDCGVITEWRTTEGYSGDIVFAVTYNATHITHLAILEHKETPSVGDRISEQSWLAQFTNQKTTQYDIISGATISSRAMIRALSATNVWWQQDAKQLNNSQ